MDTVGFCFPCILLQGIRTQKIAHLLGKEVGSPMEFDHDTIVNYEKPAI